MDVIVGRKLQQLEIGALQQWFTVKNRGGATQFVFGHIAGFGLRDDEADQSLASERHQHPCADYRS